MTQNSFFLEPQIQSNNTNGLSFLPTILKNHFLNHHMTIGILPGVLETIFLLVLRRFALKALSKHIHAQCQGYQ
jgi:hypothetical protein